MKSWLYPAVVFLGLTACSGLDGLDKGVTPMADIAATTTRTALSCEAIYLQISDLPDATGDEIAAAYASATKARDLYTKYSGKSETEIMADVDKAVAEVKELNYTDQAYRGLAAQCDASLYVISTAIPRQGH